MYSYKALVHRVIDGDSIIFDIDLGFHITVRETVRLIDCDAQETRTLDIEEKMKGLKIKGEVQALLDKHWDSIYLETEKQGKFGRWLGKVYLDTDSKLVCLNDIVKELSE